MNPNLDPEDFVRWRDVRLVFPGGHEAVRGVTLAARRGEILALLGTSGSGKTTLLKMVNRLLDPTSGTVEVQGRSTSDWDPIALRRATGYVIQEVGLLPHLSILENVALVPRLNGVSREESRRIAVRRLELVGLDPARLADRRPHQLSGGQRQRVGVARALAADARLILLDEPFGALDPISRREIQDEFRRLQQRTGTTAVLVTHDVREACRIADRLALIDAGRLVRMGTAAELREDQSSGLVRAYFREAGAVEPLGKEARTA